MGSNIATIISGQNSRRLERDRAANAKDLEELRARLALEELAERARLEEQAQLALEQRRRSEMESVYAPVVSHDNPAEQMTMVDPVSSRAPTQDETRQRLMTALYVSNPDSARALQGNLDSVRGRVGETAMTEGFESGALDPKVTSITGQWRGQSPMAGARIGAQEAQAGASRAAAAASGAQRARTKQLMGFDADVEADRKADRADALASREAVRSAARPLFEAGVRQRYRGPDGPTDVEDPVVDLLPGVSGDPSKMGAEVSALLDPQGEADLSRGERESLVENREARTRRQDVLSKVDLSKLPAEKALLLQRALLTGEQALTERAMRDPEIRRVLAEAEGREFETERGRARLPGELEQQQADLAETQSQTRERETTRDTRMAAVAAQTADALSRARNRDLLTPAQVQNLEAQARFTDTRAEDLLATRDARLDYELARTGVLRSRKRVLDVDEKLREFELTSAAEVLVERIEGMRLGNIRTAAETTRVREEIRSMEQARLITAEEAPLLRKKLEAELKSVREKTRGQELANELSEASRVLRLADLRVNIDSLVQDMEIKKNADARAAVAQNMAARFTDAKIENLEVNTQERRQAVLLAEQAVAYGINADPRAANLIGPTVNQLFEAMADGDDERVAVAQQMLMSYMGLGTGGAMQYGVVGSKPTIPSRLGLGPERAVMGVTTGATPGLQPAPTGSSNPFFDTGQR